MDAKSDSKIPKRASNKSNPDLDDSVRKQKLRENVLKRVREDRTRLLWKLRNSGCCLLQSSDEKKEIINSAFKDIVSDEVKKIGDSSRANHEDDMLWEYEGLKHDYVGDSEDILLEMQRIFYKDLLLSDDIVGDNEDDSSISNWEDEEDDYLAGLVSQHMLLKSEHEEQQDRQIWCPICKQGELMENFRHIYCNMCELRLNKDGEEVNLSIMRERLAEAHGEHLERGCRLKPKFSVHCHYNLKALYIKCEACNTFEVVV
ncbi:unnamed protein product [Cochlearia groenlandica]